MGGYLAGGAKLQVGSSSIYIPICGGGGQPRAGVFNTQKGEEGVPVMWPAMGCWNSDGRRHLLCGRQWSVEIGYIQGID